MNIMLAFNSNYINFAAVLIRSLVENESEQLDLHIIHSSLTDKDQAYLIDLTKDCDHISYCFYQFREYVFDKMPHASYLSKETYFRLLGWDLLPLATDRILYLDSDIVVNSSISDFYHQNLNNNILAACPGLGRIPQDIPLDRIKASLNINQDIRYCNAGVLLFDLNALRTNTTTNDILQYIEKYKDSLFMADQDIINGFFAGRIQYCDPLKYNYSTKKYVLKKYGRQAVNNACVYHFCLKYKPFSWRYTGTCQDKFWKYAGLVSSCPFTRHRVLNMFYRIIMLPVRPIYNCARTIYMKYKLYK